MKSSLKTIVGEKLSRPFVVVLLSLPFVHTFLRGGIPEADDTLLHLFKLVGLDFAVRHGDLWPRYAAALHYGFGSPVFNYYGLLSLYPPEILHLVLGLSFPAAFVAAVIGYALAASLGAYALGRAIWSERAGLIAAVGYLYTPALFTTFDGLAQFAALALLPWMLWSLWRLARSGSRGDFLASTALLSALVLTHDITALYAWPLALLFGLAVSMAKPETRNWRHVLMVVLPFVFAAGLTAFFWLPALAEAGFVQLSRLDVPMFDYHNNFLSLAEIFPVPVLGESGRLSYPALSLGWVQSILAAAGLIGALRAGRRGEVPWAALAAAGAVGAIFLATRFSVWLWETLPLVKHLLFPSRLLFPASLLIALAAGSGVEWIGRQVKGTVLTAVLATVCAAGMILYALPTYVVPLAEIPPTETVLDLHQFERDTGWLGGTSTGEFLPRWVTKVPHSWELTDRFAEGEIIPRLAEDSKVNVLQATWGMKRADLTVVAAKPRTLVFEWMYFPGWRATVDDQPAEIVPTDPNGLIGLEIPEGEHHIRLWFGETPVRWVGLGISFAALGVMLGAIFLRRSLWATASPAKMNAAARLPWVEVASLAALGGVIFVVQLLSI